MNDSIEPLVSVIMPVFNSAHYLSQAIDSVINQSYSNWELLIIDDGSTDDSQSIYGRYLDKRISLYKLSTNNGVSAARNIGLSKMKGDFFCFLDADDILPLRSLQVRVDKFFAKPDIDFVDGSVEIFDGTPKNTIGEYHPNFQGNPFKELIKLRSNCFFGPSWMIRNMPLSSEMDQRLTHGEDLLFYIELSRFGRKYDYVDELVLHHRKHNASAMNNIEELHKGYRKIYGIIKNWNEVSVFDKVSFQIKMRKFMTLEYLSRRQFSKALSALFQ